MWRLLSIVLAASLAAVAVQAEEKAARYSSPHLLEGARSGDSVIRRLEPGERVRVIGKDGAWLQVRTGRGETGWVRESQLREPLPR